MHTQCRFQNVSKQRQLITNYKCIMTIYSESLLKILKKFFKILNKKSGKLSFLAFVGMI